MITFGKLLNNNVSHSSFPTIGDIRLKMIRNLAMCGYAHLQEFDLPHGHAMLLRERFFVEQLWVPCDAVAMSIYATPL